MSRLFKVSKEAMRYMYKVQDILMMIIGCFLMALSINLFLEPHNIAPGGVTGLAIVINSIINIPVWLINLIFNIPLFLFAIKLLKNDVIKTLLGIVLLTVFLKIINVSPVTNDVLLSAIFGGIIMGVSMGLIFRVNGSTGGTDLLALLINHLFSSMNPPKLTGIADAVVVVLSGLITLHIEVALYSAIALYISVKVSDMIVEGVHTSATFMIVSDKYEELGQVVTTTMNRSATVINGKGFYTKEDKHILMVAVTKREIVSFKRMIKGVDPNCFIMVLSNHETLGEGFKKLN